MATLQSPGVQVSVVNESFYTPSAPGTVPLILVASAQDKINPSGNIAAGTTAANADKVYFISSQRDLTDTFGTPLFYTDASNNPLHGYELNEYGLQTAYSFLGVSSGAYVVRPNVDLSALKSSTSAPVGDPADGSYWLDTVNTKWGIFEWVKSTGTFKNVIPLIIDDSNYAVNANVDGSPKTSFGLNGQYAVVVSTGTVDEVNIWYKNSDANWVVVGDAQDETSFNTNVSSPTFTSTRWITSWPTVQGTSNPTLGGTGIIRMNNLPEAGLNINGLSLSVIASLINNLHVTTNIGAKIVNGALALYGDSRVTNGRIILTEGTAGALASIGLTTGTYAIPSVFVGPHTQYPNFTSKPSGSVYAKTTNPNLGQNWIIKKWSATSGLFNSVSAPVYADGSAATYNLDKIGGGQNITPGALYIESNYDHGTGTNIKAVFKAYTRSSAGSTVITSPNTTFSTTGTITAAVTIPGASGYTTTGTIVTRTTGSVALLATAINSSNIPYISASINNNGTISISHTSGGEILLNDPRGVLASSGITTSTTNLYTTGDFDTYGLKASNWKPLEFTASPVPISSLPTNGQLWYDGNILDVDIMINDGTNWKGYKDYFPNTNPTGPIVSATQPTTQSDGTPLVTGDIWVSLVNGTEQYGKEIYVYDGANWNIQDVTDQTSPDGWIFADARWATAGASNAASTIVDLLVSNYVDPDAPDPVEYPRGMRLWNLRRSGYNIKQYVRNYINLNATNIRRSESMAGYAPNRWVSVSPNNEDGSGTFGRYAQRAFIVKSMKATLDINTAIRDTDSLNFNLIAAPGYPEVIQNMISLNADRGLTAFVIGDTPLRLTPDATSLTQWAMNSNGALDNGETGLVSYNDNLAVYYPSGYTTDLAGNYIVVPPSHMMLRTYALSDQQSYQWFAPAGIRRGTIDNVSSVGYIDRASGEFKIAGLSSNVRDAMAQNGHINPIATLTGAGIVAYGQYTRANVASALDRVNVARLVCYLRRQLDILSRPFLFEPNDKITRNEFKNAAQSLLLELVGQRALYDFIVVCDESNNTAARIDRSELWMDIAIEPVKAVEFIYIPLRLVNTGSIKAGTYTLA